MRDNFSGHEGTHFVGAQDGEAILRGLDGGKILDENMVIGHMASDR